MALDDAYHWLHYACTTPGGTRPQSAPDLPGPCVYFSVLATPYQAPSGGSSQAAVPDSTASSQTEAARAMPTGGRDCNPLARLHRARQHETQLLFGSRTVALAELRASGLGASSSAGPLAHTMKRGDPVCAPLLARWRDAVRTFACRAYAFAVPNAEALAVLRQHSPLVEWGAGTGYWAALLQRAGADVVALDWQPTASRAHHACIVPSCIAWCCGAL